MYPEEKAVPEVEALNNRIYELEIESLKTRLSALEAHTIGRIDQVIYDYRHWHGQQSGYTNRLWSLWKTFPRE